MSPSCRVRHPGRAGIALALSVLLVPAAHAALSMAPARACALLAEHRLDAGAWRQRSAERWFCSSRGRRLPYGDALHNEMRFRAEGDEAAAHRLVLTVSLYSAAERQATLTRMETVAADLVRSALGAALPDAIRAGILAGANAEARIGEAVLGLSRRTSGAAGFDMVLTID